MTTNRKQTYIFFFGPRYREKIHGFFIFEMVFQNKKSGISSLYPGVEFEENKLLVSRASELTK